jgi:hypothetical protein
MMQRCQGEILPAVSPGHPVVPEAAIIAGNAA